MAPSIRKVALSTSTSTSTLTQTHSSIVKSKQTRRAQPQAQLKSTLNGSSFGRVTKSKARSERAELRVKFSDVEKGAFERWNGGEESNECEVKEVVVEEARSQDFEPVVESAQTTLKLGSKRKRLDVCRSESESENEGQSWSDRDIVVMRDKSKKRRIQNQEQLLSPPRSPIAIHHERDSSVQGRIALSPRSRRVNAALPLLIELPQSLLDLVSLHATFLKALSLHFAHNGASSPAELNELMASMTRLWKKQKVGKDAFQKMLGMYEVVADSTLFGSRQAEQVWSPFKIVTSGLGSSVRTNLEYVGQGPYSENTLQAIYSNAVHNCFKNNPAIDDSTKLPLLTVALGTQTSFQRAKTASTRAEILNLSTSAQPRSTPDFSKLSIVDPLDHTSAAVKSRTLSLFDRVRAKGLASANNKAPTSEQIARRHAMGRISEVVEFLRMKQQQKISSQFQSSVHDSPGKLKGTGKISFSLGAIVKDIRQSIGVAIGEEEVRICLRILSQELPGDWCRMIELGTVVSVTLQGNGMSGIEIKRYLEENAQ